MDEPVSEEDNDMRSYEAVMGTEAALSVTHKFKSGTIFWSPVPCGLYGRATATNVIKMTPGIARFSVTRISDTKTCFDLVMPMSLKRVVIGVTNLEKNVYGDIWNDTDEEYLDYLLMGYINREKYFPGNNVPSDLLNDMKSLQI